MFPILKNNTDPSSNDLLNINDSDFASSECNSLRNLECILSINDYLFDLRLRIHLEISSSVFHSFSIGHCGFLIIKKKKHFKN